MPLPTVHCLPTQGLPSIQGLDDIAEVLNVPRETVEPLGVYGDMLEKWQKAKNLVANSTLSTMWQRHFLDSAQLYPFLQKHLTEDRNQLLDIGSGAGFPGLVLAALLPIEAHMVEANGRKSSFMAQVVRQIAPKTKIHTARIEALPPFPVDFVTSRACARLSQLLEWAYPFAHRQTVFFFLKGENVEEELTEACTMFNMHIEQHPSLSSKTGVILEISQVQKL